MNKKEKDAILKTYIPIVDFMSNVAGNNCEVVLRDYCDGESEIIHIVNSNLSGRKVGEKISGYALQKIMKADYKENDCVTNYIIINESNQKVFRASTYYIKQDLELLGMICVNYDLTQYLNFRDFYDNCVLYGFHDSEESNNIDYFDQSMDAIMESMIRNVFIYWDRTIPVNKVEIEGNPIRQLYKLNIFKYKGAVNRVAELLDISTQTIYRYIKDIEDSINK